MTQLDDFTTAYLECALWASNGDDDRPLDSDYELADLAPAVLEQAMADCAKFQAEQAALITEDERVYHSQYSADELAGHDFWLTRNGHGAGFWDGDWKHGDILTAACKTYPQIDLYVGDDGLIYG